MTKTPAREQLDLTACFGGWGWREYLWDLLESLESFWDLQTLRVGQYWQNWQFRAAQVEQLHEAPEHLQISCKATPVLLDSPSLSPAEAAPRGGGADI